MGELCYSVLETQKSYWLGFDSVLPSSHTKVPLMHAVPFNLFEMYSTLLFLLSLYCKIAHQNYMLVSEINAHWHPFLPITLSLAFYFSSTSCKGRYTIFFSLGWIASTSVYMHTTTSLSVSWWIFKLFECLGYHEYCCNEHRNAGISSTRQFVFLWIQNW